MLDSKQKTMKIAYDAKRFFHNASGLGNYSRDLIRIMARYFPENEYILLHKNTSERGKALLQQPSVSYQPTTAVFLARQLKMGKDAERLEVDIFHGLSGELPLQWNGERIKKVVTIHDLIFERFPQFYSFFDRKIHYWKFKKAAQKADLVIAISKQTKRDIIDFLQISEDKIRVVYQGCHQAFKEEFTAEYLEEIRRKYALPKRFLLNVGTVEERKNLLSVVKALAGTGIPLVVVGKKTAYARKIEQEATQNCVKIQFLQGVSMQELAGLYRLADVFIYPSLFEGFGIPVIESLFSKTPVITSNQSSLPEAGGEFALYIHPKDVEDIRAKIMFLWENEPERKRRAEGGYFFVQKFKDEKIANDLMAVYREVLEIKTK